MAPTLTDRSHFTTLDTITHIWTTLNLPSSALANITLPHSDQLGLPSSFKVGHLAQATIALSALAAALIHAFRNHTPTVPRVTVPLDHACIEFLSERLYTLNAQPPAKHTHPIGGLHRTRDGYVRIHDSFPHHRAAALRLVGCDEGATREEVAAKLAEWDAVELETEAWEKGAIVAALRGFGEWDALPQAGAVADSPVLLRKIADGPAVGWECFGRGAGEDKCLRGVRVLEMSRVIAAPVAGRTLAAHGADVLWVTSPKLPDLPALDRDCQRGKRTVQLDLEADGDIEKMRELLVNADVFVQGYRPGSLAARGLGAEELARLSKNGIVHASLSAYGSSGPWSEKRGFDSMVQTLSGLNVSEAEHYGVGEASRVLPCQVLDHASGYFLAFGIMAALYKRATEGGSYAVEVSLARTMKYLRSLGQYEGKVGFDCVDYNVQSDVPAEYMETRESGFGELKAVKHSAKIDGVEVGWEAMPKPLGSDQAKWL